MSITFSSEWVLSIASHSILFQAITYTLSEIADLIPYPSSVMTDRIVFFDPIQCAWAQSDHLQACSLFQLDITHPTQYECREIVPVQMETTFYNMTIMKPMLSFEDTDAIHRSYVDMKVAQVVGGTTPYTLSSIVSMIRSTQRLLSSIQR